MFVGHYSVAFAAKTEKNKIPLWVLFIAVQFLDYIWATLVLLGIEKLRVIKGFTAGSMLDSYFHPYSHSLVAAIAWSVVAALIYKAICSRHRRLYSKSAPLIVAAAVFSHWVLDLIAHPRDLRQHLESRFRFVELSGSGVCIGNRAPGDWDRSLPGSQCDADNSQSGDNRIWNCFDYCSDRRHVCASHSFDR